MRARPEVAPPPLHFNRDEAGQFIATLAGSAGAAVAFQTFSDLRKGELARVLHGTLDQHWEELVHLNEAGAGVFVMVNEGDGEGRAGKNVRALRALFAADDSGKLKDASLSLAASMVVQSRNGIHAYWKLRPGEPLDRFSPAQEAIAQALHTDPTVKDLPRVMRLPGFYHRKDPAAPFLVRLLSTNAHAYGIPEVLDGLGAELKDEKAPATSAGGAQPTQPGAVDPATIERARQHVQRIPGAVSGARGHDQTFDVAMDLVRGFALGEALGFELLRDDYNPKCRPPWSEKELLHKVESAAHDGHKPWGYLLEPCGLTDTGNAVYLKRRHIDTLRYCHPGKRWLIWDGKRWAPDETARVEQLAKEALYAMWEEAKAETSDARRKWATGSLNASRRRAMVELAKSELPITPRELDRDPMLLNCANGTLDLRTGERREARREDFISKLAPVEYDPEAKCPKWDRFLRRIFKGDAELIAYVQRAVGYALTGDVSEEVFFLCHGRGDNGKSTFLGTLEKVLGDYAVTVAVDVLMGRERDAGRATPERMDLRGARLALAYETPEGGRLNAASMKAITSTDTITARYLHANPSRFPPTHKLFLATNHRPQIRDVDRGTWRRIRLVPFEVTIPKEEQEKGFKESLLEESAGILAWALRGCMEWRKLGLAEPKKVRDATADYREEEDTLRAFIEEQLVLDPKAEVGKRGLYRDRYLPWAEKNRIRFPLSEKDFNERIKQLDGVSEDRTKAARLWRGLGVKVPQAQAEGERLARAEGTATARGGAAERRPRSKGEGGARQG